jgi:hypothetical protein
VNNSGDISWYKGSVFISEVFDLRFSASSRSMKTSTRSIFGMLRLVSLTRTRFASGRFRSCDDWMFGVMSDKPVIQTGDSGQEDATIRQLNE